MARNEEKALNLMNRWTSLRESLASGKPMQGEVFGRDGKVRTGGLSSDCNDLNRAKAVSFGLEAEIREKVNEIQDSGLPEQRLRDLNDEINRLSRKKYNWDKRVAELGGPNKLARRGDQYYDADGNRISGGAYRYYGAAKNLPGVKELFEPTEKKKRERTRRDILSGLKSDYYGNEDPEKEDAAMLAAEARAESLMRADAIRSVAGLRKTEPRASVPVAPPVIDQAEMERRVLERRKQALLEKYAS